MSNDVVSMTNVKTISNALQAYDEQMAAHRQAKLAQLIQDEASRIVAEKMKALEATMEEWKQKHQAVDQCLAKAQAEAKKAIEEWDKQERKQLALVHQDSVTQIQKLQREIQQLEMARVHQVKKGGEIFVIIDGDSRECRHILALNVIQAEHYRRHKVSYDGFQSLEKFKVVDIRHNPRFSAEETDDETDEDDNDQHNAKDNSKNSSDDGKKDEILDRNV